MCKPVFFVVALLEPDEYAEVVCTRHDTNAGTGKFDSELIKAIGRDTFDGTINPEGRDGRMV